MDESSRTGRGGDRLRLIGRISPALLYLLFGAGVSQAKCPVPQNSALAPCLIACPQGDSVFVVIPRDFVFNPEPGQPVALDFSRCPGFQLNPVQGDEPYTVDSTGRRITVMTRFPNGEAVFAVRGGGGCGAGSATVFGWCGDSLGSRPVASPDQDGNLVVDDADVALIEAKLGLSDASADFDCDGLVSSRDVSIARAHLGHHAAALASVPAGTTRELSLAAFPNPTSRPLTVSFSLPVAVPVAIDLLDLSGRRLQTWEATLLGPGQHTLSLDLESRLPAGLYFLRLVEPSHHVSIKLFVLR
jgi:hypothetical protein